VLDFGCIESASYSDRSSDSSRYVLPWKIRRVKKHRLDSVLVNTAPSSSSKHRHHRHAAPSGDTHEARGQPMSADSDDDVDEMDR